MSFQGLILEVVSGTGKSKLFRRLAQHELFLANDGGLFLSQCYTLRMAQSRRPGALADSRLRLLEKLRDDYSGSEFSRRTDSRGSFRFVLESFHYYLAQDYVSEVRQEAFVRRFDRRLASLGAKIVLLWVHSDAVIENCVRSTLRSRGAGWANFLSRYGKTEAALVAHFQRRQARQEQLAANSLLPVMRVDTTSSDWDDALDRIVGFCKGKADDG